MLRLIIIAVLLQLPLCAFAAQFVSAPLVPVPNQTGLNSATPYQFFSQGEYINLVDGHLTLEPKGFETQIYGVNLTIGPAYNPNRNIFGREEHVFSEFEDEEYPTLDGNDADSVKVIPLEADLGIFGHFSAVVDSGEISRFKIRLNQDRWQMAINGIVGMIAVWFEPPKHENTGDDDMINPSNLPSYFLIKSDGSLVFVSAIEQGFRKAYGVYGMQNIENAEKRFNDVIIQDADGMRYHFNKNNGFMSYGNERLVETDIKAIDCYQVLFWKKCKEYLRFPGWKVQTLFLSKIEDAFGNAVDIIPKQICSYCKVIPIPLENYNGYLVKTPKGDVDIITESTNVVRVRSRLGDNPEGRIWRYTFDNDGNLLSVKDPGGLTTSYRYSLASGYPQHRSAGPVFSGDPDNVLEVHYPTGGVLRYEAFYSHFHKGVIVTEFPDPANTNDFFQKYVLAGTGVSGGRTTVFETDGTQHIYDYGLRAGVLALNRRETKFLNHTIMAEYDWDVRDVTIKTNFAEEEFQFINGPSLIANIENDVTFETRFTYDKFGRLASRIDPVGAEYRYSYQCSDNFYNTDIRTISTTKVSLDGDGRQRADKLNLTVEPFFPVNCEPAQPLNADFSFWQKWGDSMFPPRLLCGGEIPDGLDIDAGQQARIENLCTLLEQIKVAINVPAGSFPDFNIVYPLISQFREAGRNFPGLFLPFLVGEVTISAGNIRRTIIKNLFDPQNGNIRRSEDEAGNGTSFLYEGPYLTVEINHNRNTTTVEDMITAVNNLDNIGTAFDPIAVLNNFARLHLAGKRYEWNAVQDTISIVRDADLNMTQFIYDPSGNVTNIGFQSLGNGNARVSHAYHMLQRDSENTITSTVHDPTRQLDVVQTRIQDGLGFTREERLGSGMSIRYSYGRDKKVSRITFPDGRIQQFAYDGAGRLTNRIEPDGDHLIFTYGRETISQFGEQIPVETIRLGRNGRIFIIAYRDPLGRIVRVDRPSSSETKTDYYRYDSIGNLIAHQSPDGRMTTNSFDAISRLTGRSFSDGGRWSVTQFSADQIMDPTSISLQGVAADGTPSPPRAFDVTYDVRDRPTSVKIPGEVEPFIKLTYDEVSDPSIPGLVQNGLGNLTTAVDETGTTRFLYGGFGNITAVARTINGTAVPIPYIVAFLQDGFGNPAKVKYPRPSGLARLLSIPIPPEVTVMDGPEVFYISDNKGRLSEVRRDSASGDILARFEYDVADQLTRLTYGNGVTTDYTYHLSGRLRSMQVKNRDNILSSEEYEHDNFGNKTWERRLDGSVITYDYDSFNRLTKARSYKSGEDEPFFTQTYDYDSENNLSRYFDNRRTIEYHYNNHRLTSYDTGPYSHVELAYDGFGNLNQERHLLKGREILRKDFSYNNLGRLTGVTTTNRRTGFTAQANYTYDAWGRRQMKEAAGVKKYYTYGQSSSPMAELNMAGLPDNFHIYAGGKRIGILESDGMKFVHTDTSGSVRLITNSEGRVIKRTSYDARGNVVFSIGSDSTPFGFGGLELDPETGLIFTGQSYYNPLTGQIVSHNTNIVGSNGPDGIGTATQSVMSYLSDTATKLPADPGGFYALGSRGMLRTASIFDISGVDDFGGAGSFCMQVTSWPGTFGACMASISNMNQADNLSNLMGSQELESIKGDIEAGFERKIIDSIKKWTGYNLPIWGDALKIFTDLYKYKDPFWAAGLFVYRVLDFLTPIPEIFQWVGRHIFGIGPSFRELDHTPKEWDHTNIASPKNNVEEADTRLIKALEPVFGFGQDSAVVLQELTIYGLLPEFGDVYGPRGNFGLSRQVALPFASFSLQGNMAPMPLGGQIYNAIP